MYLLRYEREGGDSLEIGLLGSDEEQIGRIQIDVGKPGSGGVDIRVERVDESETGPITLVLE